MAGNRVALTTDAATVARQLRHTPLRGWPLIGGTREPGPRRPNHRCGASWPAHPRHPRTTRVVSTAAPSAPG